MTKVGIRIPKTVVIQPKLGPPSLPDPRSLYDHSITYEPGATKYKWVSPVDGQVKIEKENINKLYVAGDSGLEEIPLPSYTVSFGHQYIFHIEPINPVEPSTIRLTSNQDILLPDVQSFTVKQYVYPNPEIRGKYLLICTNDTAATSVLTNRRFYLYDTELLKRDNWDSTGTGSYIVNPLIREIDVPKLAVGTSTLYTVERIFYWSGQYYLVAVRLGNYAALAIIRYDPVGNVWTDLDGVVDEWTRSDLPPLMTVSSSAGGADQRYWHLNQITGELIMHMNSTSVVNRNITKINLATKEMTNTLMWPNDTGILSTEDYMFRENVFGHGATSESTQGLVPSFGRGYLKNMAHAIRPLQQNIQGYDEKRGLIYCKNWSDDAGTAGSRRLMAIRVKDQSFAFEITGAAQSLLAGCPTIYFEDIDVAAMWGVQTTTYRFNRYHISTLTTLVSSFAESNTTGSIPTVATSQGVNVTVNYEKRQIYTILAGATFRCLIQHHDAFDNFGLTHLDFASVATNIVDIAISSRQY
jgi:hypothetical protein